MTPVVHFAVLAVLWQSYELRTTSELDAPAAWFFELANAAE